MITRKSLAFLALAFVISWTIAIGGHFAGLSNPAFAALILSTMMTGPAIAAIICMWVFEEGRRLESIGLKIKFNGWLVLAWLIPIGLAIASVVLTLLLTNHTYVDVGATTIAAVEAQDPAQAEQMRAVPLLGLIIIGSAITVGAFINTPVLTLTEELGWRGYLHDLWRPHGFWRASLATGFVWGVWHAPAIYFYGLNYPENREIGVGLFILWCMLFSPLMTLVRDRSGSTWGPGIAHGTLNAVGGLTVASLSNPAFPWYGLVGIGGFITLAVAVAIIACTNRPALAPTPAAS